MAGLAQLVRASDCGPEGHGFESHSPPHLKSECKNTRGGRRVLLFFNKCFLKNKKVRFFLTFFVCGGIISCGF